MSDQPRAFCIRPERMFEMERRVFALLEALRKAAGFLKDGGPPVAIQDFIRQAEATADICSAGFVPITHTDARILQAYLSDDHNRAEFTVWLESMSVNPSDSAEMLGRLGHEGSERSE